MKYEILHGFPGSQDGTVTEQFEAGTVRELSDYLVSCIPATWVRPITAQERPAIDNKAIATDGAKPDTRRSKAK